MKQLLLDAHRNHFNQALTQEQLRLSNNQPVNNDSYFVYRVDPDGDCGLHSFLGTLDPVNWLCRHPQQD